jgi:endonuclease/exonuclease/phosphatase family metal-dependent hydrolase
MQLLSLNIGIKMKNTPQVVQFLQQYQADFIALQEVGRHLEASVAPSFRSQQDIHQALKPTYPYNFFGPQWLSSVINLPGKPDHNFEGHIEQGLELLSAHPITAATNEFYYKHYEYMLDWSAWKADDHGRSVQVMSVDVAGKPLQILNLHGIWNQDRQGDARTLAQCTYVVQAAKRNNIPTIIVGDFNLSPDSPSIQYMNKHFRNLITEYSIKTTRPDFNDGIDVGNNIVDYIFVSDSIAVHNFAVVQTDISDHLPLVLDFDIRP